LSGSIPDHGLPGRPPADSPAAPLAPAWAGLVLFAAAFAVLIPSLRGGWLWDDEPLILQNPLVTGAAPWSDLWLGRGPQDLFPLTWSVLRLEHGLFGGEPHGYRVVQALLHAATAWLLWRVLCALRVSGAWLGALLFAVHPLAVATGAWVAEHKNTLAVLPALAALRLAFSAAPSARGASAARLAAVALFALSLLAKPTLAGLPLVLLLLGWWRGRLRQVVPTALAMLAAAAIVIALQIRHDDAVAVPGLPLDQRDLVTRVEHAAWALLAQARHVLWPVGLTLLYRGPASTGPAAALDVGTWPLLLACAITLLAWLARRSCPGLLVAWIAFVLLLAPALELLPIRYNTMPLLVDHLAYPTLMPAMALVGACLLGAARLHPAAPACLSAPLVLVLATASWQRSALYADPEALFRDNIARHPEAAQAHLQYAQALLRRGETAGAEDALRTAALLDLQNPEPPNNLGVLAVRRGALDEAEAAFREALARRPEAVDARLNLARLLLVERRLDEAGSQFEEALGRMPAEPRALDGLAEIALRQGRPADAEPLLRAALAALSAGQVAERAELLARLGDALAALGRADEARESWRAALALDPEQPRALAGLGGD